MNFKKLLLIFKKIWIIACFITLNLALYPHNTYAQQDIKVDWFNILSELKDEEITKMNEAIDRIWNTWGNVSNEYNKTAKTLSTAQWMATWIINWNTLMNYLSFIVQFLSQLWLVVGFWFIMYAGYTYMLSVFNWWKAKSSTIKNAIIWIIIVIFSYAIMKTLTSIIGIS